MKIFVLLALFVGSVFNAAVEKADDFVLPEGVKTCDQDDPDINQCMKDAIQAQLPLLEKGSSELGIVPIDPFELNNERFDYANGNFQGTIILKTFRVYGLSKAIIKSVKTEFNNNDLKSLYEVFLPKIFVEGTYKADVKFNDIKLRPKGTFNVTMNNITTISRFYGVFENTNGVKHLRLTDVDVDPEVGDLKFQATGLFPDPTINAVIVDFINQYWPEIYKISLARTKNLWSPLVLDFSNKFLLKVPFEKLLTKNKQ